jgi:hypothetical protein
MGVGCPACRVVLSCVLMGGGGVVPRVVSGGGVWVVLCRCWGACVLPRVGEWRSSAVSRGGGGCVGGVLCRHVRLVVRLVACRVACGERGGGRVGCRPASTESVVWFLFVSCRRLRGGSCVWFAGSCPVVSGLLLVERRVSALCRLRRACRVPRVRLVFALLSPAEGVAVGESQSWEGASSPSRHACSFSLPAGPGGPGWCGRRGRRVWWRG